MKICFYGGARSVTGSNYLVESGSERILVDCGLWQGSRYAEEQNFESFPYDPKSVGAVFITHAHIDHIGRLPRLFRGGFRGKIYSTPATKDFAELLLLDSQHILSEEAAREGRPELYSVEDIRGVMDLWSGVPYHQPIEQGSFSVEFFDAGHVLGSAIVRLEAEGKVVVFSGDLGNSPAPIVQPTERIEAADYCLVESTYGDKVHEDTGRRVELLEDAIEDVVRSGGVLLIPIFALERTQEILYHLHQLFEEGRVPRVPVFVDSPLAIKVTAVYKKYEDYFNKDTYHMVKHADDILNFPGLRVTLTTEESKEINSVPAPKIILAGSGMSQGGRILHHELRYFPDPKSMILFVGHQARNSLGRRVLDNAPTVRIFGETVPVRCRRRVLGSYSAHADQPRLLEWLRPMRTTLKKVFVVQGEDESSEALARKIRDELAVPAVVPEANREEELT
ncbi:MBL fold metallo-hydrolase [Candidatus Parcubacteria bacterium]|nr:MAG: MBL fold metallo-hydrolase [Candidatus Parcubacteria bacterium]